ncbi:hypothetical protein P171DRAFT_174545 [Karstenula rhodostoma CBS 690.94]|uniref:Uncharacterized protein n=1 Tax=Karstenula rhodostoma CBS 690.94 TaxID=1392251 RepID=A0A9P4U6C4_9PLEO|nr:hypothetical protein P171DRAFT_174545 [Karstenula rhodostoma CBS 690.94]
MSRSRATCSATATAKHVCHTDQPPVLWAPYSRFRIQDPPSLNPDPDPDPDPHPHFHRLAELVNCIPTRLPCRTVTVTCHCTFPSYTRLRLSTDTVPATKDKSFNACSP